MHLKTLRLMSFRAHAETEADFASGVNLIYGPNGAGKTNLLEAIHYLCLSKSFLAARDTYALRQGCPYFEIEGIFGGERRVEQRVRLVYVSGEGKKMFVNGAPLERLAEIVGRLPVVVFSPEDYALTAEGPRERRRFLDNLLSQAYPAYLDDLMKYRRARRQRNELLKQYPRRPEPPPARIIDPWTEELVLLGSRIIARRQRFIQRFAGFLKEAYAQIQAVAERPTITYDSLGGIEPGMDAEAVAELFRAALDRAARREHERGRTLVGPQRDELVFRLGGMKLRRYGSQGQHRTFGMALKLAKYFYLHERLGGRPLLLLDDAFGKLDEKRAGSFLALLQSDLVGQSFITDTRRAPFEGVVDFGGEQHRALHVVPGAHGAQVETPAPLQRIEDRG